MIERDLDDARIPEQAEQMKASYEVSMGKAEEHRRSLRQVQSRDEYNRIIAQARKTPKKMDADMTIALERRRP